MLICFVHVYEGVETVKGGGELSKLTVAGKIDPVKLQEMVEQKIGKKVQLVSPVPKKDNKDKDGGGGGGGGEKKAEGKPDKKPDEKKSKEVMMNIPFQNIKTKQNKTEAK